MSVNIRMFVMMLAFCMMPKYIIAHEQDSVWFSVEAPDTMQFGQKVHVTYHLHTNAFSNVELPRFENFNIRSYYYPPYESYSNPTVFRDFEWKMEIVPYKSGTQMLPSMSIMGTKGNMQSPKKTIYVEGHATAQEKLMLKALQKYWKTEKIYQQSFRSKPVVTKHKAEEKIAREWLAAKGQNVNNIWLNEVCANSDVVLFGDDWNGCFVLVATEKYSQQLDNLVMAYSLESSAVKNEGLMNAYTKTLQMLENDSDDSTQSNRIYYQPQKEQVNPLLGETCWGQESPYNAMMPIGADRKNTPVGPGAVAMAQIMHYYQYPMSPIGRRFYKNGKGETMGENFKNVSFLWSNMKDNYEENERDSAVATLMSVTAYALETESSGGSSTLVTGFRNFRSVLVNNFGYSQSCRFIENPSGDIALAFLYKELDEARPVLCEGLDNFFVCDGYNDDFFHVNMGFKGFFNGFYRATIGTGATPSPLTEAFIVGITPKKESRLVKEVILKKPGTLAESLSDVNLLDITHLKISGKIDGNDLIAIRKMAGAIDADNIFSPTGKLRVLDLSEAVFTDDNLTPYIIRDASGYTYSQTSYSTIGSFQYNHSTKKVDLGKVASRDEWDQLRKNGVFKNSGIMFREGQGLIVRFTMRKGVVTPYMFENCENLEQIFLPAKTKIIEDAAFRNCNSLRSLELPPSVKEITDGCFMQCYNLEGVYYHKGKCPSLKDAKHGKLVLSSNDQIRKIGFGAFSGNNKVLCMGLIQIKK